MAAADASDETAEPNFELDGELDLTTAEINAMVAFVEEANGRPFKRNPKLVIQSIPEFEAGLAPSAEDAALGLERAETSARYFQAVGHTTLPVGALYRALTTASTSTDTISGRYDPFDDSVFIPEGALTGDMFNAILVHELSHALDGQYVDLGAIIDDLAEQSRSDVVGDTVFSMRAIVEGRATYVQSQWMMENQVTPVAQDPSGDLAAVPASAIVSLVLPYQIGAQSIGQLGGTTETWGLFDNPPTSSEQMMFPDRIGTDLPVEVRTPEVPGQPYLSGVLGAEGLLVLAVGEQLQPSPPAVMAALGGVEGWGGDSFIVTGTDTESCLTADIVADTPEDLGELESLFVSWAADATSEGNVRTAAVTGDTLRITSCAPFIS